MKKTAVILFVVPCALMIAFFWIGHHPGSFEKNAFAIGSSVCHQIPSHSFINNGTQFPLCARCSGLYLGSAAGLIYLFSLGKRAALPDRITLALLALLFLAWAGDGINSLASEFLGRTFLYSTTNQIRLATGFGMGLVMSTALTTLFNTTVWKNPVKKPVLHSPWQTAAYAIVSLILGFMLTKGSFLMFRILSYVSILTVLVIITALYTIFWILLLRKENTISTFSSLIIFLIAGFGTAISQIFLLNMMRSAIVG